MVKDCCCKDIHRDTCYAIRYPNSNPLDADYHETCECPCHDQYDDDECDCHDCNDEIIDDDDMDTMADDYKLMSEIAREERESDLDKANREGWKQEDGNWDD